MTNFTRHFARTISLALSLHGAISPSLCAQNVLPAAQTHASQQTTDAQPKQVQSTPSSAASVATKRAGTVRIGVVLPIDRSNEREDPREAEALRSSMMQLLTGPSIETVKLAALVPNQVMEEAKLNDCDFVLTSKLAQKQAAAGGHFGRFANMRALQIATTAAQFIPVVQEGALVASMMTGQMVQQTLMQTARSFKANADITLDYTLTDVNGKVAVRATETAHTRSEGENVLTPMLSATATKVVAAATAHSSL